MLRAIETAKRIHAASQKNVALKPASIPRVVELARNFCTNTQWGEWLSVPLEHAAAEGDQELVEELLVAGASGDPIGAALRSRQFDLVRHLLDFEHGPRNLDGRHLCLAVELEEEALVALFLSRGLRPQKDHALRLAVSLGNEAIVSMLWENGARPDDSPAGAECDRKYSTPLLIAVSKGHAQILRLLLDAGASAGRRLSLDKTFRIDRYGFVQQDVTVKTECALDKAAIKGRADMIKAILERSPSLVNSVAESTGNTALLYAVKHHQPGAVDALIEAGAGLNARDCDGVTALHVAARSPDYLPILRMLLIRGADVDAIDRLSTTPLFVAVKNGNKVGINELVSAGADVNKALIAASRSRSTENDMVRTLLVRGADANTRRALDGSTPLHLACKEGFAGNVKVLLEAGGDETAVDASGRTPGDVVGESISRFAASPFQSFPQRVDSIRTLLANAPSDRAWRRRALLVLCRKFPSRVHLDSSPRESGEPGEDQAGSVACQSPVISQATKKAARANEVDHENRLENPGREEVIIYAPDEAKPSCNFTAAMSRLLSLEADEVFRKIVAFL